MKISRKSSKDNKDAKTDKSAKDTASSVQETTEEEDGKKSGKKDKKKTRPTFDKPLDDLAQELNLAEGSHFSMAKLSALGHRARQPFGAAVLDYMSGGGAPLYTVSSLWGAESAGKSSLFYDQIAAAQAQCWRCHYPSKYCKCSLPPALRSVALTAVEGVPDISWMEAIGVDPERVYISLPESAEHAFDIMHKALHTDVCLAGIDSISMISPEAESDASAEQQFMALQSRAIGRFLRTTQNLLNKRIRADAPVSVMLINQMRYKIGVIHGSPETRSGGSALKHTDNLLVRVSQVSLNASVMPDKLLKAANNKKESSGVRSDVSIRKRKFFTLGKSDSFVRLTANHEAFPGVRPGQILDAVPTIKVALACKVLEKTSKGYKFPFLDKTFQTQQDIIQFIMEDRQNKMLIVKESIAKAYEDHTRGVVAPSVTFGPDSKEGE